MSKRCSIFGEVSLAAVVVIFFAGFIPVSAQTAETRPRSLTNSIDDLPGVIEEKQPPVGSPEANTKAKKLYKTGIQYGNAGLYTQAADTFRLALALKPDYSDAYRSLGHAYIDLNQAQHAVEALEQAISLNPKDKEARRLLDEAWLKVTIASNEPPKAAAPVGSQVANSETASASPAPVAKSPEKELPLTRVYRVGPGDVLDITLSTVPTPDSMGSTVATSGLLTHSSLLEPLAVAGLTLEEITDKFQNALKQQGSTANPKVSVGIRDYVSHAILVSGLVKDPGTKILRREGIPLAVVVADAQPLPEAGSVTIVRNESNETFTLDLTQPAEMSMLVRSGDVLTLIATPPQYFYVAGDVKTPGEKLFRRGLTLTQAIFVAGGPTGKGKEVRISRENSKGFLTVIRYKLSEIDSGKMPDPLIQPGDRIMLVN